ncbi:MAG TPA: hypothetical protein DDZ81_04235 [Acetobacteraceae bacterium]|nr:hypothetical protein [Acetobacteraceae bacterium]
MDLALKSLSLTLISFVLPATEGDPVKAGEVIADMIQAYEPADTIELDLIGRIVGFGLAAMDNIRLSIADPDLPPATILRHRTAAASLSRSAEKCRTTLNARRAASQPEAAKPRAPKSAPVKSAAPKSRAAQPASDATLEKTAAEARAVLERLDRLHEEWASTPNVTPMHRAPFDEEANQATAEPACHGHLADSDQETLKPRRPPQPALSLWSR